MSHNPRPLSFAPLVWALLLAYGPATYGSVKVEHSGFLSSQTNDILCNTNSEGDDQITIGPEATTLFEFVEKINHDKHTKIVLDSSLPTIPIQLSMTARWQAILRMLMDQNNLGSMCYADDIVLIKRLTEITRNSEEKRLSTPIIRATFKLRYIRSIPGSSVDLANQGQGTAVDPVQSLEGAIRSVLRADGDPRSQVERIAGTNEFLVSGRPDQIDEIAKLIARVDRPGRQLFVQGILFSINEKFLRRFKSPLSAIITADENGFPSTEGQDGSIVSIVDSDTMTKFLDNLNYARKKGIVTVFARPFGTTLDGTTLELIAGTQIPITQGSLRFVQASRVVRIRPQVSETSDGELDVVRADIQLENNVIDASADKSRDLSGIDRQAVQTTVYLEDGQTVFLGGLSDAHNKIVNQTPFFSSIPGLGELFKRRRRETLFCALTIRALSR